MVEITVKVRGSDDVPDEVLEEISCEVEAIIQKHITNAAGT